MPERIDCFMARRNKFPEDPALELITSESGRASIMFNNSNRRAEASTKRNLYE
jgi:hypothetical protein